jgi:excisionase family DNA binding protein
MNVLTVKEVAERWNVSRSIVYALVASGILRHVRVGIGRGTIRIEEAAVVEYEHNHHRDDEKTFAEHFA